jgi:hypothetical protein
VTCCSLSPSHVSASHPKRRLALYQALCTSSDVSTVGGVFRATSPSSSNLVRHNRIYPTKRKRSRWPYKRWERSRSMVHWRMDIVGRFHLANRTELKMVTRLDDHSRFCVCPAHSASTVPLSLAT